MSHSITAFRALVRKDVIAFLRDRRALVVNVMTPIAIAAFFGFVFGGGGDHDAGVSKVPVAVVDLDHSPLSSEVIADLKGDATLAVEVETRDGAHGRVKSGKLRAAIIVPAGFGSAAPRALFAGGEKPQVELEYEPSQSLVRPMLEGILTQYVMQAVTKRMFSAGGSTEVTDDLLTGVRSNPTLKDTTRSDLVSLLEAARRFQSRPAPATGQPATGGLTVPFALQSTAVTSGPKYNAYAHSFAGMAVQFILFMGIDAGVSLLLMRELGVWRRLRAAPVSRGVLLGSRVVGTALISLLILGFVYGAAMAFFGVRISGSVPGFVGVAVVTGPFLLVQM
jgi:ABC-2 type transport system permease protein